MSSRLALKQDGRAARPPLIGEGGAAVAPRGQRRLRRGESQRVTARKRISSRSKRGLERTRPYGEARRELGLP